MTNTEFPEPIDPTDSLLQEQFLKSVMGPSRHSETTTEVQDFTAEFTEAFGDALTPTPEEWEMIQRENAALREKVKAKVEEEALKMHTEIIREENAVLREKAKEGQ